MRHNIQWWRMKRNPPATPTTPTATASASQVIVSWPVVKGAAEYELQRSNVGATTGFATVYTGSNTSFTDAGLEAATTYWYRLRASNLAGTSSFSNVLTATTSDVSMPPAAPTVGPTVVLAGTVAIDLELTPVADADRYILQRFTPA